MTSFVLQLAALAYKIVLRKLGVRWHHIASLSLAILEVFVPQKSVDTGKSAYATSKNQLLKIFQHTLVLYPLVPGPSNEEKWPQMPVREDVDRLTDLAKKRNKKQIYGMKRRKGNRKRVSRGKFHWHMTAFKQPMWCNSKAVQLVPASDSTWTSPWPPKLSKYRLLINANNMTPAQI